MNEQREPDELDALLKRTTDEEAQGTGNPLQGGGGIHRKSYSVDVASSLSASNEPRRAGRRHRKNKSSISQLYDAFKNKDLAPIREDFLETAQSLRTNFVGSLDQMDKGGTGFFDMAMTRSLSILPENIPDLAHEAGVPQKDQQDERAGKGYVQYLALFSAVVAISSNSTALHMLDGVSPALKLYWRMTASYVALSPLAINYFMKDGMPNLTLAQWITFVAAAISFAAQNTLFYTALDYTTIGNAVVYANSQALLLIIGKAFVGERIHEFEACGVVVAFSGAILCSRDSEAIEEANGIYGDLLALTSAICGVAYLTFAKAIRSEMSVTVFIFCVMVVGSFFVLLFISAYQQEPLYFNMDKYAGVFGWLDQHRLPYLIYLAVVCNMIGTMGFVRGEFVK
jgi:drug/metabolite transporter (DMT)-like permease